MMSSIFVILFRKIVVYEFHIIHLGRIKLPFRFLMLKVCKFVLWVHIFIEKEWMGIYQNVNSGAVRIMGKVNFISIFFFSSVFSTFSITDMYL